VIIKKNQCVLNILYIRNFWQGQMVDADWANRVDDSDLCYLSSVICHLTPDPPPAENHRHGVV